MKLVFDVPNGENCGNCAFKCNVRESNYFRGYDVTKCRIFDENIDNDKKCNGCKNQPAFVK